MASGKYEVFLSFRGEDTRNNFTSHLHSALCHKLIKTFIDDKLSRGDEITPALLKIIEESKIAIIVFSKDYASSTFCLDEVAKIIECNETRGLIVVPVFYHVDPSDVEDQNGSFKTAFAKHEANSFDRVESWKAALSKAASMAGWHSGNTRPESKLVDEIVEDTWEKLNQECSCDLEGLVGIYSRINEIRNLLAKQSGDDVRILGIWGMGGIGKTTLTEAVFKHIACQFEGCCFLANVKEASVKDGGYYLIKELLSQVTGVKDACVSTSDILRSPVAKRMVNKKVLVVVDDVNSSLQLEFFKNNRQFFGKGSRILVTSRDKQTLLSTVDDLYEVKKLGYSEAGELFSQNAFKKASPLADYQDLPHLFIGYADGNPLALKVLGSSLYGKNQRVWKSALDKLRKAPDKNIQNVLKISYDSLDDNEKDIFLHVACFFRGNGSDKVTKILDGCGLNTDFGLSILIDKSLITIRGDETIEMHDLLQEMGKEIVRQESREPGKRSRLWDHEDIVRVLTKDTGTEEIEAISLDMSKIDEIDLNPDVFKRMSSLKILNIFNGCEERNGKVQFSQGLEYLPDELRYLYWHGYPVETLPDNFHPVDLVELYLPYSKLKLPPKKDMNLKRLQNIDLHHSSSLVRVPELSRARNLVHVNVSGCKSITSFPSTSGLMFLETVDLSSCSKLETFPEVSSNTRHLDLSNTAIKEVPESLGSLIRLKVLSVADCIKLESLPSSICKLKSLATFEVSGCSSLQRFPEILETMDNSMFLNLNETAIEELPSSIENLKGLHWLSLQYCRNLTHLPESLCNLQSLSRINFSNCSKLGVMPANMEVSYKLEAHGCYLLRSVSDLSCLSLIKLLDLRDNRFETLPVSIKQLDQLTELDISLCDRLQSLPDLPQSLIYLKANDCRSLETVSGLTHFFDYEDDAGSDYDKKFLFVNCLKLTKCLAELENTLQLSACFPTKGFRSRMTVYPGNEIPEWFTYTSLGDSIEFPFPKHSDDCRFCQDEVALCLVLTFPDNYDRYPHKSYILRCLTDSWSTNCEEIFYFSCSNYKREPKSVVSQHVALCYPLRVPPLSDRFVNRCASLTFSIYPEEDDFKVTKCGIHPLCTCLQKRTPLKEIAFPVKYDSENEKYCWNSKGQDGLSRNSNASEGKEKEEPPSKRLKQS